MENKSKVIAIFDYDGTLAAHDSIVPFMVGVAGWPRLIFAFAITLLELYLKRAEKAERRSLIKVRLVKKFLTGKRPEELAPIIEKLKQWSSELETAKVLREHYAKGHHVLIASGSLDIYLPHLLENLPHHALICTNVEVKDGVITGNVPKGNCVRHRKAERITEYLKEHGPFEDSWGYGNKPHDVPMLELVRHQVII